jgi:hypothetical protein
VLLYNGSLSDLTNLNFVALMPYNSGLEEINILFKKIKKI